MNECSLNNMFIIICSLHPVGASDEGPFNVPALSLNQRAILNAHVFVLQILLAWGLVLLLFLSVTQRLSSIIH